jgi:non-heme chloroperoxidase
MVSNQHTIEGGRGLALHVREWGNLEAPPILFIHGWSQSHLCWAKQYESWLADEFRLVALDIRGHGMSDKPLDNDNYSDAQLWADDIAAVIRELRLDRPVIVGWSYGAFIICDYVRVYGQEDISGINFVEGTVSLGQAAFGTLIGPGFLDVFEAATADDLQTNIQAMRDFLRGCTVEPLPQEEFEVALGYNTIVPSQVRAHLATREIDSDDVLSTLGVPVLVTQGRKDIVVLPTMAEHILSTCPTAKPSWYEEAGHAPFLEAPERFNRELAEFRRSTQG